MLFQNLLVLLAPSYQFTLLAVMCNQRDILLLSDRQRDKIFLHHIDVLLFNLSPLLSCFFSVIKQNYFSLFIIRQPAL